MFELFRKGEILPDGRSNSDELHLLRSRRGNETHSAVPEGQDDGSRGQAQRRPRLVSDGGVSLSRREREG
jgi:hypothetical protein